MPLFTLDRLCILTGWDEVKGGQVRVFDCYTPRGLVGGTAYAPRDSKGADLDACCLYVVARGRTA